MQLNFPFKRSIISSGIIASSIVLLTACGGGGSSSTSTGGTGNGGTTPPANSAPTVSAGADASAIELTTVQLNAIANDSDGTIASISWAQTNGQQVALQGADTGNAMFSAPLTAEPLTLSFTVTVTDDDGTEASDDVVVTIEPSVAVSSLSFNDFGFSRCVANAVSDNQWQRAAQVTSLSCPERRISSIAGVGHFVALQSLDLSNNLIEDGSPITELVQLTDLDIGFNHLDAEQIAAITAIKSWQKLGLAGLYFDDVASLSGMTQLQHLDISSNDIPHSQVLTDTLTELDQLAYLNVGSTLIQDYSFITDMPALVGLDITDNLPSDWSPIMSKTDWQSLGLVRTNLSNLDFVTNMLQLRSLNVANNWQLEDFSPLIGMTQLEELTLRANTITEIEFLSGLINLKYLDLGDIYLYGGDFSPLAGMTQLEYLDTSNSAVSSLIPFAAMTQLKYLDLGHFVGQAMSDYEPLYQLTNLEHLATSAVRVRYDDDSANYEFLSLYTQLKSIDLKSIGEKGLENALAHMPADIRKLSFVTPYDFAPDLSALGQFSELNSLDIQIENTDFSFLSTLHNLEVLDVATNDRAFDFSSLANSNLTSFRYFRSSSSSALETVNLNFLGQLPQLKDVLTYNTLYNFDEVAEHLSGLNTFISSHGSVSSSALNKLSNLRTLSVLNQPLEDLAFLAEMPKLKQLNITSNGLESMTGVEHGQSLARFYSAGNGFSDITALSGLDQLTSLTIEFGAVENISPIASMSGLRYLRLNYNNISDISAISQMSNLRMAYLRSNNIDDLSPIADKPYMTWLMLSENPFANVEPLFTLPNLDILLMHDNNNVSDEDFARLEALGIRYFAH